MIQKNSKHLKYKKALIWSLVSLLAVLILPLFPYALDAYAGTQSIASVPSPGSDLWREVRQRDVVTNSRTQIRGMESGTFINVAGESWRQYRMEQLIPISAKVLIGVVVAILLFALIRRRIPISAGRSGKKVLRFTLNQRTVHWLTALSFVLLGLTGVVLLYGRFVLIPVLGADGFGATALVAKKVHDYVGPAFGIFMVLLLLLFIKGNFPSLKTDILWLLKGGGIFGKHASAARYNAGEKLWYWAVFFGGLTAVFSGLVLDFPAIASMIGDTRETREFYHMIHSIAAVGLMAFSLGHIFMGTYAMEGTLEIMVTGYADENWAKEHHDLWYEEIQTQSKEGKTKLPPLDPDPTETPESTT